MSDTIEYCPICGYSLKGGETCPLCLIAPDAHATRPRTGRACRDCGMPQPRGALVCDTCGAELPGSRTGLSPVAQMTLGFSLLALCLLVFNLFTALIVH